jgi:hypothetical protein
MGGGLRRQNSWKESVMKYANPGRNREIDLIVYQGGWLSKRRYCSKHGRDGFVPQELQKKQGVSIYFEWLLQPIENPRLKLKPAVIRARAD